MPEVDFWTLAALYAPLGVIGAWRWSVWIFRQVIASQYRPRSGQTPPLGVSVVTPVYNEDPVVFLRALTSWQRNQPAEIIAVIDAEDLSSVDVFREFSRTFPGAKLLIIHEPGKRPALAMGIRAAENPIVALVDSDTIWAEDVLKNVLPTFHDDQVGGVGTRQSVDQPRTIAQKIFDIQLNLRYSDEVPFLATLGNALQCLSGRTAFYRTAAILPLLEALVHETFWGQQCISGEDKRLTYLVQEAGWKVRYQGTARVWTPGAASLRTLFRQRLRWLRNSWRANLRALNHRWLYRNPVLAFHLIDQMTTPFTTLLGPTFLLLSMYYGLWVPAGILVVWWHLSRLIKLLPHLRHRPADLFLLPMYVLSSFVTAMLRIYALMTLNQQGWITRWDPKRLPRRRILQTTAAVSGTFSIFVGLAYAVVPKADRLVHLREQAPIVHSTVPAVKGATTIQDADQEIAFASYEVAPGDTLDALAKVFGTTAQALYEMNPSLIPSPPLLTPGQVITVPQEQLVMVASPVQLPPATSPPSLRVGYDQETNTITVLGRGQVIGLRSVRAKLRDRSLLEEITPREWILRANLALGRGVTLRLEESEVTWLKLLSTREKFVWLHTYNGALLLRKTKVTSWDEGAQQPDMILEDGRSYIVAKYNARMDVVDSELAYLGYNPPPKQDASTFGVSWKLPEADLGRYLVTGIVRGNTFHHNYFGAYTYGATGMLFQGNSFSNNHVYGLDPHDDSDRLVIDGNRAYGNGLHGIILSKRCSESVIKNNESYDNQGHGIMLDSESNNNKVSYNRVFRNNGGIVVTNSSDNMISGNEVLNNQWGIRLNVKSTDTTINANIISRNQEEGIRVDAESYQTVVTRNLLMQNLFGIQVASSNNRLEENVVSGSDTGLTLVGSAGGNAIRYNTFDHNILAVVTKNESEEPNVSQQNTYHNNRFDRPL